MLACLKSNMRLNDEPSFSSSACAPLCCQILPEAWLSLSVLGRSVTFGTPVLVSLIKYFFRKLYLPRSICRTWVTSSKVRQIKVSFCWFLCSDRGAMTILLKAGVDSNVSFISADFRRNIIPTCWFSQHDLKKTLLQLLCSENIQHAFFRNEAKLPSDPQPYSSKCVSAARKYDVLSEKERNNATVMFYSHLPLLCLNFGLFFLKLTFKSNSYWILQTITI